MKDLCWFEVSFQKASVWSFILKSKYGFFWTKFAELTNGDDRLCLKVVFRCPGNGKIGVQSQVYLLYAYFKYWTIYLKKKKAFTSHSSFSRLTFTPQADKPWKWNPNKSLKLSWQFLYLFFSEETTILNKIKMKELLTKLYSLPSHLLLTVVRKMLKWRKTPHKKVKGETLVWFNMQKVMKVDVLSELRNKWEKIVCTELVNRFMTSPWMFTKAV